MKILKGAGVLLLLAVLYLSGALVANNAAFTNTPGALNRLEVYFTMNRAWTTGGYPLPEVGSRTFYGVESKLRANAMASIRGVSGWRIEKAGTGRLDVAVSRSFWHGSAHLAIFIVPVPEGIRMDVVSRSLSTRPDLGANRNYILILYHAIGDENALHPPA